MSNDYIFRLRQKIGKQRFIHPGARILVENHAGEFLFIKRRDNGRIALPGGGLEENESIQDCIIREVFEETGIEIRSLQVIGISTDPGNETVQYPNGDVIQYFTIEFYSNEWEGTVQVKDADEVIEAAWLDASHLEQIPDNEKSIMESWNFFKHHGYVRLK